MQVPYRPPCILLEQGRNRKEGHHMDPCMKQLWAMISTRKICTSAKWAGC